MGWLAEGFPSKQVLQAHFMIYMKLNVKRNVNFEDLKVSYSITETELNSSTGLLKWNIAKRPWDHFDNYIVIKRGYSFFPFTMDCLVLLPKVGFFQCLNEVIFLLYSMLYFLCHALAQFFPLLDFPLSVSSLVECGKSGHRYLNHKSSDWYNLEGPYKNSIRCIIN